MTKSNDIDYMKIHFTWIDWDLEYQKEKRDQISKASEEERIELAKHMGLDNVFLLRRTKDPAFENLIYFKILNNRERYKKIMPKLSEILSKNIMYSEDITKLIKNEGLRSNIIFPFESDLVSSLKMQDTNRAAIEYLRLLLKYHIKNNNLEDFVNVQSYLKEYISGIFQVNNIYQSAINYSGKNFSVIYGNILKSFLTLNLKNYLLYETSKPTNSHLITQISSLFAFPLKEKLKMLVYQILDVEQNEDTIIQYQILFNNLLSVASMLYFSNLSLNEKLELLNNPFEMDDLISLLEEYNYEWDFIHWKFTSSSLINAGFNNLALKLNEIILKNHFNKVRDDEKYFLFDGLGVVCRNLEQYEKANDYFQKAFEWIDVASSKGFSPSNEENIEKLLQKSKDYWKAVCIKNVGESYGHAGLFEESIRNFVKVEKIIIDIETNMEKFHLFVNLSVAYNRLNNFTKERDYLNKALEFLEDNIPLHEIDNIEKRIDEFRTTEMSYEKLILIETDIKIRELINSGDFSQNSFCFNLSINFYKRALEISENFSFKKYISIIYVKLAMSFFYLGNWEESRKYLENLFSIRESPEFKLNYFIVLYLTGDIEKAISLLNHFPKFLKNHQQQRALINTWLISIISSFGREKFVLFFSKLKDLENELRLYYLFILGNALADNGFSNLALKFFKCELEFIKEEKFKATIYNDIGGVYSDMDNNDKAIDYFKKAVKSDENYDLCYRNLAEIYSRKLDNVRAKRSIEKAIEIAKKKGKPELDFYKIKLIQINQLLENIININDITTTDITNILTTAEQKIIDYRGRDDNFDASDIILGYSKALEIMLDKKVAIHLKPLINQYKKVKKHTSDDFNKKFGFLFRSKTISLGTWARIFEDFKKKQIDPDVKVYRDHLKSNFTDKELEKLKQVCQMVVNERNSIAHTGVLNINQVMAIRKKLVPQFNLIIKILYD